MKRRDVLRGAAALAGSMLAPPVTAAAGSAPTLSEGLSDLAIIRQALALHPGLHRYLSPAAYAAALSGLDRAWQQQPAPEARYLALTAFLARIRCGHSYCNFFNQRAGLAGALFDRPTRLPFHFVWLGGAMVVTNGFATGLPRGTVIERLNGERPQQLLRQLLPYVRADGHNDAKRISLLEVRGDDAIETFDVFQGLLRPPAGGEHRLSVRLPGGRRRTLSLPALGLAARRQQMPQAEQAEGAPLWQWQQRSDGIAVLTMDGWGLWNSKWDWRTWLDERLDSLAGARGLVIDIRNNEGGDDCGNPILARLIDRPLDADGFVQRLRFRSTPPALDPYLDTWDDSSRRLGEGGKGLADGWIERPGSDDAATIEPAAKRLRVPVRVLTSPVNSSATFQFARNFAATGAGKLVGRPTGGNRRGINGGSFFFVRLPDSGIEFDLPLIGYFARTPQPDAGLLPDIAAAPTAATIAAGSDPVLDAALASLTSA